MTWITAQLSATEWKLVRERPAAYVAQSAYRFASSFALVALVVEVVYPKWALVGPPARVLFVAVVGGLLGALFMAVMTRRDQRAVRSSPMGGSAR